MAQDEATSGYFEMPRAAIDLGRSDILPPRRIALALNVLAEHRAREAR
jgi:chemotaxis response regulator CheB